MSPASSAIPRCFDLLAETIIPDLVRSHAADQPLRIWIAGCSTGEETYSLAMLFREAIASQKSACKTAVLRLRRRSGCGRDRAGRAVSDSDRGRRVGRAAGPLLRQGRRRLPRVCRNCARSVVFTVQDVLADPPFSRLDLVSCRNLLIYLRPEAQAKVISLFHFALRPGGILLLGSAETVGDVEGRFEVISKPQRIYRHIGRSRPGEFGFLTGIGDGGARPGGGRARARPGARRPIWPTLCRRLVLESYAPAAVLINQQARMPVLCSGRPTAICAWRPGSPRTTCWRWCGRTCGPSCGRRSSGPGKRRRASPSPGGRMVRDGQSFAFGIEVQPVSGDGRDLLLVCFVDEPKPDAGRPERGRHRRDTPRVAELEHELDATRSGTARRHPQPGNLRAKSRRRSTRKRLSVNEEYQSTNEELLTSKEELQSLNEELTALNSQLQETLERQRTTSNDLQNVLYSTDVATLFLDADLKIRFFTPATQVAVQRHPGRCRPAACGPAFAGAPMPSCWPMRGRCCRTTRRSSARSRRRTALGFAVASCPIARRTTASKVWSSPSPTSPSAKAGRRGAGGGQAAGRTGQRWRSRASSPPPATICASRCRRWPCCRACWRRRSKASGRRSWWRGSTRRWARCPAC